MDDIITQLGLVLTQTRFARRALEDIERATARYGSLTITASAATPSAAFGSPPLLDGALRVYVVNIQDLGRGGGFGDTIAGLFGGVGAFIGNLVGGAVGGTIGSITLVESLGTINTLVGRIERIVDKLGLGKNAAPQTPAAGAAAAPATPPAAGGKSEFLALLSSLHGKFVAVTALLQAANGPAASAAPGGGAGGVAATPSALAAPDAERWRAWVGSLTAALEAGTRLVGALNVAVPTVIAGLSWLLDRLPDLRNAITETLRFIVRNALVLRGAVIVLAYETIAMIARVTAMAVRILAATVNDALAALFAALAKLLDAALELGGVLAKAIIDTVQQLLVWLVPRVYEILWKFGELRLFLMVERLLNGLPLLRAIFGDKKPEQPAGTAENPPAESRQPIAGTLPRPDLKKILDKAREEAKTAVDKIIGASRELVDKPTIALGTGLTDLATKLDEASEKVPTLSDTNLADRLKPIGEHATASAESLLPITADQRKRNVWDRPRSETVFRPIAAAYGQWLATDGLKHALDSMVTYFPTRPGSTDGAPLPGADAAPVVQIDEVVIDIAPIRFPSPEPNATSSGPVAFSRPRSGTDLLERHAVQESWAKRRGSLGLPPRYVTIFDFDELD